MPDRLRAYSTESERRKAPPASAVHASATLSIARVSSTAMRNEQFPTACRKILAQSSECANSAHPSSQLELRSRRHDGRSVVVSIHDQAVTSACPHDAAMRQANPRRHRATHAAQGHDVSCSSAGCCLMFAAEWTTLIWSDSSIQPRGPLQGVAVIPSFG